MFNTKLNTIMFGDVPVGDDHPPMFLPDIDMFFNGDIELAKSTVSILGESGVKVIKAAVISSAEIALDDGTEESYYSPETGMVKENYRQLMERKVMTLEKHEEVFSACKSVGAELVVSVYDIQGAEFAKDVGVAGIKIPSSNVTHEPLIKKVSSMGLPVILDTGKSDMEEIARAVQWVKSSNKHVDLIIEHSPEAPPAPLTRHNLRMMQVLRNNFGCHVGLSDHHDDDEMMYAAVAMGAVLLEKGVCSDNAEFDQDVNHAMRVSDVAATVRKSTNIYHAMGDGVRVLSSDREKPIARMGLIAAKNLEQGDKINLDNIKFAFPARGIPTEEWSTVENWQLKVDLNAGDVITWEDVVKHVT